MSPVVQDPDGGFEFFAALMKEGEYPAASPRDFMHLPGAHGYNVEVGMIVEASYLIAEAPRSTAYWLATVVSLSGLMAKLRWIGCGDDSNRDFCRNVGYFRAPRGNQMDLRVHHVGWCNANGKPRLPPQDIELEANWEKALEGRQTLPENFHEILEAENECVFAKGVEVESVYTKRIAALMPAVVVRAIGRRIEFRFKHSPRSVWWHEFSHMFFPIGMAQRYDRELIATLEYWRRSNADRVDDTVYHFRPLLIPDFVLKLLRAYKFEIGAKLELIDPLEPGFISVGTIVEVLRDQYLKIKIDGYSAEDGSDMIYAHATSDILLPAGFAAENNLMDFFRPPHPDFTYENVVTVPRELFQKITPSHNLRSGMFIEVLGCSGTDLIYVGRIERVVGHIMRVHFEGYDAKDDQFVPISSPDVYCVGWSNMVGHRLYTPARME